MFRKPVTVIILLVQLAACSCLSPTPKTPEEKEFMLRQQMDMESLVVYRRGLDSVREYIKSRKDIFPDEKEKRILPVESREELRGLWRSICDYFLAIDSLSLMHTDFMEMPESLQPASFNICRGAMLIQYRFAMDFIAIAERAPDIDVMLNESMPDVGLPGGTYKSFKFRFLNIAIASRFAAYEASSALFGKPHNRELKKYMSADSKAIWKMGLWKGELMTAKNGIDILKKAGKDTWFPVQKGVSNWAGDTRVYRPGKNLITAAQIEHFSKDLRPGDIMLERREWYLTNIGIPGFWTHAAIYIGTPDERAAFFNDASVQQLLNEEGAGSFEEILMREKKAYALSIAEDSHGIRPRIVEAIGEGVLFTTIEHSADCDSIAVLRPLLPKYEIARAIIRSFRYSGRPYDFDFDFRTDSALVCTELVYKSYEKGKGMKGISFSMESIMGRDMVSANGIARMYSEEYRKGKGQMKFILFYDGSEKKGVSVKSTGKKFRKTHSRPKWHILVQE